MSRSVVSKHTAAPVILLCLSIQVHSFAAERPFVAVSTSETAVHVLEGTGFLDGLNSRTGRLESRVKIADYVAEYSELYALDGGFLLCDFGRTIMVDSQGRELWSLKRSAEDRIYVHYAQGRCAIFGTKAGGPNTRVGDLFAIDPRTGSELWRRVGVGVPAEVLVEPRGPRCDAAFAPIEGAMDVVRSATAAHTLRGIGGIPLWRREQRGVRFLVGDTLREDWATDTLDDPLAWVSRRADAVRILERAMYSDLIRLSTIAGNGHRLWRRNFAGELSYWPLEADEGIFVSISARVYLISGKTGRTLWVSDGSPGLRLYQTKSELVVCCGAQVLSEPELTIYSKASRRLLWKWRRPDPAKSKQAR